MKLISTMALLPDALDNSVRKYLKRSFVVALIAAKVFLSRKHTPQPPPAACTLRMLGQLPVSYGAVHINSTAPLLHHVTYFRMKKAIKKKKKDNVIT